MTEGPPELEISKEAALREVEAAKRRQLDQLGAPAWPELTEAEKRRVVREAKEAETINNKAKFNKEIKAVEIVKNEVREAEIVRAREAEVARVASLRISVEEDADDCKYRISRGCPITADMFGPFPEYEWYPDYPDFPDFPYRLTLWDILAEALRKGRKTDVTKYAYLLRRESPPRYVRELIADFFEGKLKIPKGPPRRLVLPPSSELKALRFYERLEPTLRAMFPTQKASEIKRLAKKSAAARYDVTVANLESLIGQAEERRR